MTHTLMGLNPLAVHALIANVAISSATARPRVFFVNIPLIFVGYSIFLVATGGDGVSSSVSSVWFKFKFKKLQISGLAE